jgi:ABC-type transporter Mla MlaB component
VTYRIQRSVSDANVVLALSGDLDANHVVALHKLLADERERPIVLDLSAVMLVDRDGMECLARVEEEGAILLNCPEYVRTWIGAERRGPSTAKRSST